MKTKKLGLLAVALLMGLSLMGQINVADMPVRKQYLNQYTSVFISSPKSGTVLQQVRDQNSLSPQLLRNDKYQFFNQAINNYVQLDQGGSTPMTPGMGYVLQLGGYTNDYTAVDVREIIQNFSGGTSFNNGTISVPVTAGKFALLGNPYNNYLDLDYFLLNSNH